MFAWSTTSLILAMQLSTTLVVYSDDGFNLTSPGSITDRRHLGRVVKLDKREDVQTKEYSYNVTDFRRFKMHAKLHTTTERRRESKNKRHLYNCTGSDCFGKDITFKRIFEPRHRFNNWTRLGNMGGRKGPERASNRRQVRETTNTNYDWTIPDGFRHYYVPSSSIANAILLYIIHPYHTLFLQQLKNVTVCLANTMLNMNTASLRLCYEHLMFDSLFQMWMRHLVGFIVVASLTWLAAVFMLVMLPIFVCCRISFQPVVAAGKLDSYSNATWTVLVVLSGLAVLFALFGVITVGCAGLGVGYYLKSGRTSQIWIAYDQIRAVALAGVPIKPVRSLRETNDNNVCRRR